MSDHNTPQTLEADLNGENHVEADAAVENGGRQQTSTQAATNSNGINRSDAIRQYLQTHPGAKPATIQKDLADEGVEVSKALIANIKHRLKQQGTTAGKNSEPPKTRTRRASNPAGSVSVPDVLLAKQLVDQVGSIEKAKKALRLLQNLT